MPELKACLGRLAVLFLEAKAQQREDFAHTIASIYHKEGCKARRGEVAACKWHSRVVHFPYIERPNFKQKIILVVLLGVFCVVLVFFVGVFFVVFFFFIMV